MKRFIGKIISLAGAFVLAGAARADALTEVRGTEPDVCVTVTLDANGGTCPMATKTVAEGEAVGVLPKASLEGQAFLGWFTEKAGGTAVTAETAVTADVTYFAQWQEVTSAVTVTGEAAAGDSVAEVALGGKYSFSWGDLPDWIESVELTFGEFNFTLTEDIGFEFGTTLNGPGTLTFKMAANKGAARSAAWTIPGGVTFGGADTADVAVTISQKGAATVIVGEKASVDVGLKGQGYATKTLPKGLSYSDKTGRVTGTCKTATDADGVKVTFTKKDAEDVVMIFVVRKENEPTVACAGLSDGPLTVGVTGGAAGVPLEISAESGVRVVTAKNLPPGLTLAQDRTTKEWAITGTPTKAGTFTAEITLTTVAGAKVTTTVTVTVVAMPATTVGTANGFVLGASRDDPYVGTFQFASTEAGKLAAKVVTAAGTHSFSAAGWTAVTGDVYYATIETKKGERLWLALDTARGWNETQLTGTFAAANAPAHPVEAQRNAFGKLWYFDATGNETDGWTLSFAESARSCALTVTLNADGRTSVAGTLPTASGSAKSGGLKVSASGYADVRAIADGALVADFASAVSAKNAAKTVKRMLTVRTNLWFDRKNGHREGVGSAAFAE